MSVIRGLGVSPNRDMSMAPAIVILRLGFWNSISAPGRGRGCALDEFEQVHMGSNVF